MEYEIVDEKLISETEVKEKYAKYVDSNLELGKKLVEHITKNIKLSDFDKAFSDIQALNLSIRDDYIRMIIDAAPTSVDQVRAILSPLKEVVKEEDIKKILAVLKKYS